MNLGSTINTAANEFVPAFTPDGHWMFFASDRVGGFGLADIYETYRADVHDDFGWQAPIRCGCSLPALFAPRVRLRCRPEGHEEP